MTENTGSRSLCTTSLRILAFVSEDALVWFERSSKTRLKFRLAFAEDTGEGRLVSLFRIVTTRQSTTMDILQLFPANKQAYFAHGVVEIYGLQDRRLHSLMLHNHVLAVNTHRTAHVIHKGGSGAGMSGAYEQHFSRRPLQHFCSAPQTLQRGDSRVITVRNQHTQTTTYNLLSKELVCMQRHQRKSETDQHTPKKTKNHA